MYHGYLLMLTSALNRVTPNLSTSNKKLKRGICHGPPAFPYLLIRSLTGHSPSTAPWNTSSHPQDIPHRLSATRLRARGLTVTAEGQRVPPWLVWWLPVSQTAGLAKTPTLHLRCGELQAQTAIRPPQAQGQARLRPLKGPEGGSRMGPRQSQRTPP